MAMTAAGVGAIHFGGRANRRSVEIESDPGNARNRKPLAEPPRVGPCAGGRSTDCGVLQAIQAAGGHLYLLRRPGGKGGCRYPPAG